MLEIKDQIGRSIQFKSPAKRVVSLVPSLTELVYDLAGKEVLQGCTIWCVHPIGLKEELQIIGGTKNIQIETIRDLNPDLIVANREENLHEQLDPLLQEFPVYVSDIKNVDHCLACIKDLGQILAKENEASKLINKAKDLRASLLRKNSNFLYFIWKNPYMVAGPDTYISALLEEIGFNNLAPVNQERYPKLEWADIQELNPEIILLSSEPYAFNSEDTLPFYQQDFKVKVVDGERLSWYGSRLIKALEYLNKNTL